MLGAMLQVRGMENLKKPVCYQGEYNTLTRGMEMLLLPLFRKHGMAFNAFRYAVSSFHFAPAFAGNSNTARRWFHHG